MSIPWNTFLVKNVGPAIADTLVHFDRPEKLQVVKNIINNFVNGRGKVIGAVVRQSGKLFDTKENNTLRNIFAQKDSWKTITVKYTSDFNKIQDYMAEAVLNCIGGYVRRTTQSIVNEQWGEEKNNRNKKGHIKVLKSEIRSSARGKVYDDLVSQLNSGTINFNKFLKSMKDFNIVSITQWFDLSSLHMRGNGTDTLFQGAQAIPSSIVGDPFKKDCSYRAFEYYYKKCIRSGDFDVFSVRPQYKIEEGVLRAAKDDPKANTVFSPYQINSNDYISTRVKELMMHDTFVCRH